ncbi:MAG: hypothetical protein H0U21_00585 [Acidimicrobiia bacterium]|nr:hypothetical protein [Acidimicrobiia bacterium]
MEVTLADSATARSVGGESEIDESGGTTAPADAGASTAGGAGTEGSVLLGSTSLDESLAYAEVPADLTAAAVELRKQQETVNRPASASTCQGPALGEIYYGTEGDYVLVELHESDDGAMVLALDVTTCEVVARAPLP